MNWIVVKSVLLLYILTIIESVSTEDFQVYWNFPTDTCYKQNVPIPLDDFGIIHNQELRFNGDQIVVFYERKFGMYPFYDKYELEGIRNGGLPQTADMEGHLQKVREDIEREIPREDFAGVAVIDFEEWRPLYDLNWGDKKIYQEESIRLARQRNPTLSDKGVKLQAAKDFNNAAEKFFLKTISLGRKLRPYAKWGFYGFPYCNYPNNGKFNSFTCSDKYKEYNERMRFVTSSGSALFPSIYLWSSRQPADNGRYIQAILNETLRISATTEKLPYYAFNKFEYDPYDRPEDMYNKKDLCNSVKQTSDRGAVGMILWSASKNMNSRCKGISEYVRKVFGPTLMHVKNQRQQCREKRCSGRGECFLVKPVDKCTHKTSFDEYTCTCDSKYSGSNCEK